MTPEEAQTLMESVADWLAARERETTNRNDGADWATEKNRDEQRTAAERIAALLTQ